MFVFSEMFLSMRLLSFPKNMPDESLTLRTPNGFLAADGLHQQQVAIEKQQEFQRNPQKARAKYGEVFVFVGLDGERVIQPRQNCDEDRVRS